MLDSFQAFRVRIHKPRL